MRLSFVFVAVKKYLIKGRCKLYKVINHNCTSIFGHMIKIFPAIQLISVTVHVYLMESINSVPGWFSQMLCL